MLAIPVHCHHTHILFTVLQKPGKSSFEGFALTAVLLMAQQNTAGLLFRLPKKGFIILSAAVIHQNDPLKARLPQPREYTG